MKITPYGSKANHGYFLRSSFISSFAVAFFVVEGSLSMTAPRVKPAQSSVSSIPVVANGEVLGVSTVSSEDVYQLSRSPRDRRGIKLEDYLEDHNSPMAPYADLIVSESDKYGVDYKLVVAIAYHESGLGRKCWAPHNAWGWMTKQRWDSWEEGITKYIRGLYTGYYAKGANTIDEIAPKYVMTPAWPEFVVDIKRLMSEIPD